LGRASNRPFFFQPFEKYELRQVKSFVLKFSDLKNAFSTKMVIVCNGLKKVY